MKIEVIQKKVWGKTLFYASNREAQQIVELIGSSTLTKRQLKYMHKILKWPITIRQDEKKIEEILEE